MKYILVGLLIIIFYQMVQYRFDDKYEQGYKDGAKNALKTNPPSEDLEMVCVGLWIGEQNKKFYNKSK